MIAAFAIATATGGTGGGSSPSTSATTALPAITAPAPPNGVAQSANCTKLLATLPISLDGLPPRIVHTKPDSLFVVAWGQPAVLLSCGAARPKQLQPGSSAELSVVDGLPFEVSLGRTAAVYTTVDRAPYISLTFPAGRQPADYLPTLSKVIAAALPAVCTTNSSVADPAKLCTRRP